MAKNTLSVDEIFSRLEEVETLKRQAVDQLLAERKVIDDKLAKLGYTSEQKLVKKRHRRTKAEIAAARAAGEKG